MNPDAGKPAPEEQMTGGNMNDVTRSGDTVVRTAGEWTPTIHRLLKHLRAQGIDWVPEPRGHTGDGREVVSFIEGDVPSYPMPAWIWNESILTDAVRKLRKLHDATVEYADPDAIWRQPAHDPPEVICHNDFAPYNMVFRDERCVGAIDFDMASPGPRIWDLAYLAYRIVPLTNRSNKDGIATSDAERMQRLDRLIDAYGHPFQPEDVLVVVRDRLDELVSNIESNRPDLADHAALYRTDSQYVGALLRVTR